VNEYKEAFDELQDKNTFRGMQWFGERQQLVEEYSWAIPNEDVLTYLAEFRELIEVGAGNGYWAHCIDSYGGNVIPIERDVPDNTYTELVERDAKNYTELRDKPVLMVWPPFDQSLAYTVAKREPPHILYVGELRGGCTGSDEFFDVLDTNYGLAATIDIPSYTGINDNFYHYVRKV